MKKFLRTLFVRLGVRLYKVYVYKGTQKVKVLCNGYDIKSVSNWTLTNAKPIILMDDCDMITIKKRFFFV